MEMETLRNFEYARQCKGIRSVLVVDANLVKPKCITS